ncbi:amidohydrolase family protein [Pseudoflavitalea sp. X16]|uniref:amidohydrolase family protein n=1 Tax=Paraflavitalea devenefica TaxID=2716334 RepID=UPI0014211F07|nr:amidohydrolase family protein [Paraflavitalea devenefica]NII26399.1 amidohydrolase family protein [Paraflavitalea devenefica]
MKWTIMILFAICSVSNLFAQPTKYLIKAGKFFDSEKGVFTTNMVILVNGPMIDTVKVEKDLTAADRNSYPQVIDLSAYTVMHGLIDCHTHLLYKEFVYPNRRTGSLDLLRELEMDGDAYRALYGAAKAKAYLENGIVWVQDLGNSGSFADLALRKAIRNGLVAGPDMSCSGPGLATEGGQLPGLIYKYRDIVSDEYRIIKGVDDAIQAVREHLNQGVDVIKIYSNNTPNVTKMRIEEIAAIAKEAHRHGRKVTAHASDNESVWNAVTAGVNGIEHGYSMDDSTMQLMASKKVNWVATLGDTTGSWKFSLTSWPEMSAADRARGIYRRFKRDSTLLQRGIKNGLTIVCGSDDYLDNGKPPGEATKHVLIGYVEKGMSIPAALQTATVNATRHIGIRNATGSIKRGQPAHIVAFGGNLDKDIHELLKTAFVMKWGKIYINISDPRLPANR